MPVGESAAVSWPSCLKNRRKMRLTSFVFTPDHKVENAAARICRQVEDDGAAAHLAIFDIGVIAGRWINTDADQLTAVGTVNAALFKYHHRLGCPVGV